MYDFPVRYLPATQTMQSYCEVVWIVEKREVAYGVRWMSMGLIIYGGTFLLVKAD